LDTGRIFVYLGSALPDPNLDLASGPNDPGVQTGYSVASAGDVNGDGFDDFLAGAPFTDSPTDAGRAYLYFGAASPNIVGWTLTGDWLAGDRIGSSVASAGDVNGDGFDDVIVASPGSDAGGVVSIRRTTWP
jgi:hypothetical protein